LFIGAERRSSVHRRRSHFDPNQSFKRPNVGGWLRGLGLEEYEAAFRDNKIDDTVLP
jgi:hypothetical protein